MKKSKFIALIILAVALSGCASRKTEIIKGAKVEKIEQIETDKSTTEIIETVKKETIVPGDTIKGSAKIEQIKKPEGYTFENENQKIKITYDVLADRVIYEGIQKTKRQIEEVRREIKQQNDKQKTVNASAETTIEHRKTEVIPTKRNGWFWFKFGLLTALFIALVWKFRRFIPYVNKL